MSSWLFINTERKRNQKFLLKTVLLFAQEKEVNLCKVILKLKSVLQS